MHINFSPPKEFEDQWRKAIEAFIESAILEASIAVKERYETQQSEANNGGKKTP